MSASFPAKIRGFFVKNVHDEARQIENFKTLAKKVCLRFFSPFSPF